MRPVLVVLLSLSASLLAQPKPDTLQQNFRGHVHEVRELFVDGNSTKPWLQSEQTFNDGGWLTEFKQYMPDGQLSQHTVYKRQGRRIIEADSTSWFPPEMAGRIVTTFEEHGFPIDNIHYAVDGTVKERITTDYEETQIVERHYDGNDKLIQTRTISTLHDPNSPDRHIEQKVNGKPEVVTDIHKTGEAAEVHQQVMAKSGAIEEQSIRQIDSSGARAATMKADGSSSTFARRQECHDIQFGGDHPGSIHQQCDEKGRMVEEVMESGGAKTVTHFTYETDDQGNWTRRYAEAVRDGQVMGKSTVIREITYY